MITSRKNRRSERINRLKWLPGIYARYFKTVNNGILFGAVAVIGLAGCGSPTERERTTEFLGRQPVIDPDYTGIVLPPNTAPLNFVIREPGTRFQVLLYGDHGDTIRV
ncbi:MAG: hypothetical protein JW863_17890, partial [Chitinispirillaceae bacterium]|nr:hypothetical protein [Chitinispirillaceae bacterium]